MLVLILFECVQALSMTTNCFIRPTILSQQSGAHITPTTEPGVSQPCLYKGARLSYPYYTTDTYSSCSKPRVYIV